MKKNNFKKNVFSMSLLLLLGISFTSCEDDSLPEAGSIPDLNGPTGAFSVSNGSTSSLVKVFRNTSLSATGGTWFFPDGVGEFISECEALATDGCSDEISTDADEQVFYKFYEFGTYDVAIEAFDALGVVSEVSTASVVVESSNQDAPTIVIDYVERVGDSNFQRLITNNSANDSGGITWSISLDGEALDMATLLETNDVDFANQTETDDSILVNFPGSGDYEVMLTAYNFDNLEASGSETVTVLPLSEPVPEFTFSSSEDYAIKTFVNTTPDTGRVVWNFPDGVTFENGTTAEDETVDVSFPSSGTYEVSLDVYSDSFDEEGNAIELEGIGELVSIPVVNSLSEITTPIIYRGSFEPGIVTNPADATNFGTSRNDLGREWWIPDGVSSRVYLGDTLDDNGNTIEDPNKVIIDTGLPSRSWFTSGLFNQVRISSSARTGDRAAAWNSSDSERIAVQTIEVVPGVDYTVTFYYENRDASESGLRVLILDEGTSSEADLDISSNIISQVITSSTVSDYVEETISFTVEDSSATAVKLYFRPATVGDQFYLDDVSIAID